MRNALRAVALAGGVAVIALAAVPHERARVADLVSAPISDIAYDVTFDTTTAARRTIDVAMTFSVGGPGDVVLSLPAWTPGSYEIDNFARNVVEFTPVAVDGGAERALAWEKADFDTWRVTPAGAKRVAVRFRYLADTFDNGNAWSSPDAAFFNGTNLFFYAEGRPMTQPATVRIHTDARWRIATGMTRTAPGVYGESNYHDLVDMPFLIGNIDLDSARVVDRWVRFATYPAGAVRGVARRTMWDWIRKSIPPEAKVFGETPWSSYTVLQVADSGFNAWTGLEHQNSHLDLVGWFAIEDLSTSSFTPDLYAHEIFHSWNVKRLRPLDMWPYRYDRPEPTTLLWVSEGITDYYAVLAEVRGGVVDENGFLAKMSPHIDNVMAAPPVSLEDASLTTWIKPKDGTDDIYYDKGALAGFLLDIEIRSATGNRHSLDEVMRDLYQSAYKQGRGFTTDDFWKAASRAAGGQSFASFEARYVHGRDVYPYDSVFALAGLTCATDTLKRPVVGIHSVQDSSGAHVTDVDPGSTAALAGVQIGDVITAIDDLSLDDPTWRDRFWARYASRAGLPVRIAVVRDGRPLTLTGTVQVVAAMIQHHLLVVPGASAAAERVRHGIITGTLEP